MLVCFYIFLIFLYIGIVLVQKKKKIGMNFNRINELLND